MSDNDFRAPNFKKGQLLKATELTLITDGVRATPLRRTIGGMTRRNSTGQSFKPHRQKSQPPGAALVYVEITGSTSISQYTATIYDNPTDRVSVEAGVTVYAKKHDAGTIPNSSAGKGLWAILGNDDKYYLIDYSVFHG